MQANLGGPMGTEPHIQVNKLGLVISLQAIGMLIGMKGELIHPFTIVQSNTLPTYHSRRSLLQTLKITESFVNYIFIFDN